MTSTKLVAILPDSCSNASRVQRPYRHVYYFPRHLGVISCNCDSVATIPGPLCNPLGCNKKSFLLNNVVALMSHQNNDFAGTS